MKAGFDTTVITPELWDDLLNLVDGMSAETPYRTTGEGWVWPCRDGKIVTSHNPYTGFHFDPRLVNPADRGMLGYVGIEGTSDFVDVVFNYIDGKAEYVKDYCYGNRDYI